MARASLANIFLRAQTVGFMKPSGFNKTAGKHQT